MRDQETNRAEYDCLSRSGGRVTAGDLRVGDMIRIGSGQRVPADLVILATNNEQGTVFIKTDQLDGETDWKLRKAVRLVHHLPENQLLASQA